MAARSVVKAVLLWYLVFPKARGQPVFFLYSDFIFHYPLENKKWKKERKIGRKEGGKDFFLEILAYSENWKKIDIAVLFYSAFLLSSFFPSFKLVKKNFFPLISVI